MRSQPNPLAGLAFLHIAGLAVVRAPESTPYPTCAMGCSPALGDRPAEQVRAPSLAEVVDKSAYTGRLGYTHPTPALRLCPTPDRLLIRRGPRRPKTNFVDKGAFTGRMGYAHPTDAPGPAWTRAKACGLSDPQNKEHRPAPECPLAAQDTALRPVPCRRWSPRPPSRLLDALAASARRGWDAAGRPPQPAGAPSGVGLRPRG